MINGNSNTKFDFEWNNIKFKGIKDSYGMMPLSQVARQYVKATYPGVKVWIKTDSFSMGDSIDFWIDPRTTTREQFKEMQSDLEHRFQYGTFDGMTDSSGYKTEGEGWKPIYVTYENGRGKEFTAKYASAYARAPYGAKDYEAVDLYLNSSPEWSK